MSTTAYQPKRAAYQGVGRIGLLVHPKGELFTPDWREIKLRLEEHAPILKFLILWGDGTLTLRQYARFDGLQRERDMPIVMFTDSTFTRGFVKLKHWFTLRHSVFPKSHLETGLNSLELSRGEVQAVRRTIREMERMIDWSVQSSGRIPIHESARKDSGSG